MIIVVVVMPVVVVAMIVAVIVFRRAGADAFHVMVMAFLGKTDFRFEPQNLRPVFAHLAVHRVGAFQNFPQAFLERVEDLLVVVQVWRLDEFDIGMPRGDLVGIAVDSVDQDAGEQEVGEHDDPLVAKLHRVFEAGLHQRERDAGIAGFRPAEAHAFPQHARHLGDVRIGVGVRCAAAHDHQQCFVPGNIAARPFRSLDQRLLDAVARRLQHFQIDRQLAPVIDLHAGILRRIGIEDGGNIVLRMARREQHAGHGQHPGHALIAQFVEPVADDRRREFQETVFDRMMREARLHIGGDLFEFAHGIDAAAAMAADHDAELLARLFRKTMGVRMRIKGGRVIAAGRRLRHICPCPVCGCSYPTHVPDELAPARLGSHWG